MLDKAKYLDEVKAATINAYQHIINGGGISAAFQSLAKVVNKDGATDADYLAAGAQIANSIIQVISTNGHIKKAFGTNAALIGLINDFDTLRGEYKELGTVGSDTVASFIANATGGIAQLMKKVPPIAALKFGIQLALEGISLISSFLSVYLPSAEANAISNKVELEILMAELDITREMIFDDFISNKIPAERDASLLNYVNQIKQEAALIGVTYEELEGLVSSKAKEQSLAGDFFSQQGLIVKDVIERAIAKESAIDNLEEVYSNEEFELFLLDFIGRYDIDADVFFEGEVSLIFGFHKQKRSIFLSLKNT